MNDEVKVGIAESYDVLKLTIAEILEKFKEDNVTENEVGLIVEMAGMQREYADMQQEYENQLANAVREIIVLEVAAKFDKEEKKQLHKKISDISEEHLETLKERNLLKNCVLDAQIDKFLLGEQTKEKLKRKERYEIVIDKMN